MFADPAQLKPQLAPIGAELPSSAAAQYEQPLLQGPDAGGRVKTWPYTTLRQ